LCRIISYTDKIMLVVLFLWKKKTKSKNRGMKKIKKLMLSTDKEGLITTNLTLKEIKLIKKHRPDIAIEKLAKRKYELYVI